jgi:hypothetical protein
MTLYRFMSYATPMVLGFAASLGAHPVFKWLEAALQ